jgi:putative nucleotidyltransferase with HDIG domain
MPDKAKIKPVTKTINIKRLSKESGFWPRTFKLPRDWFGANKLRWAILILLSLVISVLLFPNILVRPTVYKVGDVAKRDIKASRDFLVENRDQTEKDREKAGRESLAVYDLDKLTLSVGPSIRKAFEIAREYYSKPFDLSSIDQVTPSVRQKTSVEQAEKYRYVKQRFFNTLEIPPDEKVFSKLAKHAFPSQVEEAVILLITELSNRGIVDSKDALKNHMDKGGIILHDIFSKREITVTDFDRFNDLAGARTFLAAQARSIRDKITSPDLAEVTVKLAQSLLRPNVMFNQRETEVRKELARKSVKPSYFVVNKGEMLVREGERIGPEQLLKLSEEMKFLRRMSNIGRVPAMAVIIGILLFIVYIVTRVATKSFRGDRRDLFFNAATLLAMFIFIWAYSFVAKEVAANLNLLSPMTLLLAMPIAFGAMLVSIFQGIGVAVTFSLVISFLGCIAAGGTVELFIYFLINSILAAHGVRNCNERTVLIKTGLKVGVLNILLSITVQMIHGSPPPIEYVVSAFLGFLGGLLSGVIATGILPLVEMSFGYTTDIKLLELGNLDQPLLRELMVQSPGTYHHSVIISNMVEATAKAIQANPLLAKVSAYYHDIGKMKKPLYFIENQMEGENKHEKLAPSMSSLILISHVKDGVELAREHKLGREIIDIIQQHHGTSLISYFYHKAKERLQSKSGKVVDIKEEDFRYPGPKPQTKEAGLVMLADMVEAASRSLVDPTPSRIQGMVQKIINKVFSDGQLDDCELTLRDLHEIAKGFNITLSGIFHHRIEYPEIAPATAKKAKNGNTDQVTQEDSGSKKQEDKAQAGNGLKRLGLT